MINQKLDVTGYACTALIVGFMAGVAGLAHSQRPVVGRQDLTTMPDRRYGDLTAMRVSREMES